MGRLATVPKRTAERGCSSGVEHNLAKVGVEGSNPFARSKFFQLVEDIRATARGGPADPSRNGVHMVSTVAKMDGFTYRLIRLAPGSYDLELDGAGIASVVRDGNHGHHAVRWFAELLDEAPRPPRSPSRCTSSKASTRCSRSSATLTL